MDDKLKVFWNLDVLVKMCRSKSDGPSLRIEENELKTKVKLYKLEIDEINAQSEDESYDTSAEMADRNIEIITKKQLQSLKLDLKEKNKKLTELKEEEKALYESTYLLRDTKNSYDKYIASMSDRINEATDYEVIDRYNALIAETSEKAAKVSETIETESYTYRSVQDQIIDITSEIERIEEAISKKNVLLAETQANLENKDNYIDRSKKEKNNKRIAELQEKIDKLEIRIEEIRKDPKYIESKIKDAINSDEEPEAIKSFLIDLINIVIKKPYMNIKANKELEEELLKATQARDTFANEIDQKSYNVLEVETPSKLRIDFLNDRIAKWQKELSDLKAKIAVVDQDSEFEYEAKDKKIAEMIESMKKDLKEFQKAYDETPESNIGAKASIKVALDEKKDDIIEAEKIATEFRKDESEDIANATRTIKYECEKLNSNIKNAQSEIVSIKNRLMQKKSGAIDIGARNKDKDVLKELAQTVIDLKHRRQFAETPIEIIARIEKELEINLKDSIDLDYIEATSTLAHKSYDEITAKKEPEILEEAIVVTELPEVEETTEEESSGESKEPKRGIKVVNETQIAPPNKEMTEDNIEEVIDEKIENKDISEDLFTAETMEQIIEEHEEETEKNLSQDIEVIKPIVEAPVEEIKVEEPALDIEAIVDSVQPKEETNLSVEKMFTENNTEVSKAELTNELEQHLNNLNNETK